MSGAFGWLSIFSIIGSSCWTFGKGATLEYWPCTVYKIRSNIVRNFQSTESNHGYYLVNGEYIAVHSLTYKLAFVIILVTEYNAKSTQDTAQHASLANLKLSCAHRRFCSFISNFSSNSAFSSYKLIFRSCRVNNLVV